jgi:hypothetical protein
MERRQKILSVCGWIGGIVFAIGLIIVAFEKAMGMELSSMAIVNMILGGFLLHLQQAQVSRMDMLRIVEHLSANKEAAQ